MAELTVTTKRTRQQSNRFALAFALTVAIMFIEIVAGLLANSLALLSDAAHIVTDVFALGLAWFAVVQANRPATLRNSWGYHRVGIIAALLNSITLIAITFFIGITAIIRLHSPLPVNPPLMIIAALLAIAINVLNIRILSGDNSHTHASHTHSHDLNKRAALLHLIGDVGASAAVIVGALVIELTHWLAIDAIMSIVIAVLLVYGAVQIGRDAVAILLESAPRGLDVPHMVTVLQNIPGVYSVHHVHVWSLTGTIQALSCHAIIDDMALSKTGIVLSDIRRILHEQFNIDHATVQFEGRGNCKHSEDCACGESNDCGCVADPAQSIEETMVHSH